MRPLFTALLSAALLLLSCNNKTTNAENKNSPGSAEQSSQEPTFAGQWLCTEKNWKVVIIKVDKYTYNVKWWYNLPSDELEEKASGTYTYYEGSKMLSLRELEFKFAEDGRLYETSQAVFFTKE